MQIKLLKFDKYKESDVQFMQRVNQILSTVGEVQSIHAAETQQGDILFTLSIGDKAYRMQQLCLMAWIDLGVAEDCINSTLNDIKALGKKIKFVNIITLGKSARVVASILVESGGLHEDNNDTTQDQETNQAQGREDEQDEDANVKSKPRGKRKTRS